MANDPMRSKAAAVFGKEFMNVVKGNNPTGNQVNGAQALQKRANARPIPVYKDGGQVSSRVANRAAMAGYKKGGECGSKKVKTSSDTARKLATEMGGMKDGGKADARLKRKMDDIEKDYKIALAKGKNEGVAKAKYDQRMADAQDDYAKWTGSDRSKTSAAEKAAEAALTEARRTNGASMTKREEPRKVSEAPAEMPGARNATELSAFAAKAPAAAPKARVAVKPAPRPALVKTKAASAPRAAAPQAAKQVSLTDAFRASMGAQKPAVSLTDAFKAASPAARNAAFAGAKAGAPAALARKPEASFEQKKAARLAELKAAADAPGASQFAKDRYRYAAETGMVGALKSGGKPEKYAAGGAGKTRKGQAPIKRKQGGTTMKEGVSTRPTAASGRRITIEELNASNRDVGGMSAKDIKKIGEAIGRGNRTPYEPIPKKAKGGAAKVRKGMMSQKGDILQAVKPKKGIGGIM